MSDLDTIARLTAERDRARATAVALEQELAELRRNAGCDHQWETTHINKSGVGTYITETCDLCASEHTQQAR